MEGKQGYEDAKCNSDETQNIRPNKLLNDFSLKEKIFQVVEELRLRRIKERENAEKVDELLTQTLILKREQEEEREKLSKEICHLKQQQREEKRKYDEKLQQFEEEKIKNGIAMEANADSFKSLKDELMTLQLSKHNLEKRLTDQSCEHELQLSHRGNQMEKMRSMELNVASFKGETGQLIKDMDELRLRVSKVCQFTKELKHTNHHLLLLTNALKNEKRNMEYERMSLNVRLSELQAIHTRMLEENKQSTMNETAKPFSNTSDFLEKEIEKLQEENKRLTERLIDTTELVEQLTKKLTKKAFSHTHDVADSSTQTDNVFEDDDIENKIDATTNTGDLIPHDRIDIKNEFEEIIT